MGTLRITPNFKRKVVEQFTKYHQKGDTALTTINRWREFSKDPGKRMRQIWGIKASHIFKDCNTDEAILKMVKELCDELGIGYKAGSGSSSGNGLVLEHVQTEKKLDLEAAEAAPVVPMSYPYYASVKRTVDTGPTNQLSAAIKNKLTCHTRNRIIRNRDCGDLDTTKLVDIATGTNLDSVFCQTVHGKKLNVAVQIVMDVSGSMDSSGIQKTAVELCKAMATTLEQLRIPVEILAFDERVFTIKGWNTKNNAVNFEGIYSLGGTQLPRAMATGAVSLASRREARHVQFILTDGSCGSSTAHRLIQGRHPKLECYAFGLDTNVYGAFKGCVHNIKPENMIPTVAKELLKVITS
jgi:hypothetical protein